MSYSRFLSSYWYTYWQVSYVGDSNKVNNVKDEQTFSVDCEELYTYRQLKDDMEGCIRKTLERVKVKNSVQPSDVDIEELKDCMQRFIKDVEEDKDLE